MGAWFPWVWILAALITLVAISYGLRYGYRHLREKQSVEEAKRTQQFVRHGCHMLLNDLQVVLGYHQLGKKEKLTEYLRTMMIRVRGDQHLATLSYPPLTASLLDLERGLSSTRVQLVVDPRLRTLSFSDGHRIWRVLERLRIDFLAIGPQWLVLRLERQNEQLCVRIATRVKDVQVLADCVRCWRLELRRFQGRLEWKSDQVLVLYIPLSDTEMGSSSKKNKSLQSHTEIPTA